MVSLTIYTKLEDYNYLKDNDLKPSELLRKAIIMHKSGEIREERFYLQEIERLQQRLMKLQNLLTEAGATK